MNAEDLTILDQLTAFLEGTQPVAFQVVSDKDSRLSFMIPYLPATAFLWPDI